MLIREKNLYYKYIYMVDYTNFFPRNYIGNQQYIVPINYKYDLCESKISQLNENKKNLEKQLNENKQYYNKLKKEKQTLENSNELDKISKENSQLKEQIKKLKDKTVLEKKLKEELIEKGKILNNYSKEFYEDSVNLKKKQHNINTLNLNKTKLEKTVEEEQIKLEEIQNQIIEKQSNLKDELKKTGFEKAKTLADEIKKQTDDTIKQKLLEKKQKLNIYNDEIEKIDLNIKQLTEQLKKCHPEVQVGGSNNLDTDCPNRDFI